MKNYFVAVRGNVVKRNINKNDAIKTALLEHNKQPKLGTMQIGIGKTKVINDVEMYTMQPYDFYITNKECECEKPLIRLDSKNNAFCGKCEGSI